MDGGIIHCTDRVGGVAPATGAVHNKLGESLCVAVVGAYRALDRPVAVVSGGLTTREHVEADPEVTRHCNVWEITSDRVASDFPTEDIPAIVVALVKEDEP